MVFNIELISLQLMANRVSSSSFFMAAPSSMDFSAIGMASWIFLAFSDAGMVFLIGVSQVRENTFNFDALQLCKLLYEKPCLRR